MKEEDILYQNGDYWIMRNQKGYYEIIRDGITHGTVCMVVGEGPGPNLGLDRAKAECDKRAGQ